MNLLRNIVAGIVGKVSAVEKLGDSGPLPKGLHRRFVGGRSLALGGNSGEQEKGSKAAFREFTDQRAGLGSGVDMWRSRDRRGGNALGRMVKEPLEVTS